MPNMLANKYLEIINSVCEQFGPPVEVGPATREDLMRELNFLSQARSVGRCLQIATSALRSLEPETPVGFIADLIECSDNCIVEIMSENAHLPELQAAVASDPRKGEDMLHWASLSATWARKKLQRRLFIGLSSMQTLRHSVSGATVTA